MSAIKWTLLCGAMFATAVYAMWLMAFLDVSQPWAYSIGTLIILASVYPFSKAQKAYARGSAAAEQVEQ